MTSRRVVSAAVLTETLVATVSGIRPSALAKVAAAVWLAPIWVAATMNCSAALALAR